MVLDECICLQRFPGESETNAQVRNDFARSLIELGHNSSQVQNHHISLSVVVIQKKSGSNIPPTGVLFCTKTEILSPEIVLSRDQ